MSNDKVIVYFVDNELHGTRAYRDFLRDSNRFTTQPVGSFEEAVELFEEDSISDRTAAASAVVIDLTMATPPSVSKTELDELG